MGWDATRRRCIIWGLGIPWGKVGGVRVRVGWNLGVDITQLKGGQEARGRIDERKRVPQGLVWEEK